MAESRAKKIKIRQFKESWLDEDNFRGWLTSHPTENKAMCNLCNKTIRWTKIDLIKHSQTVKHIDNISSQNKENLDNNRATFTHKDKVKRAEIKLAVFFTEHNIAFNTADYLIPLLKDIFIDSKIA